ncbi:EAL domain-containing response regulator [Nisaea sediminum]|uniref:EAL domain-containing response regulator n=1 Tax=Nisaea sediminum TaxID=2775867 RepID=UPI0018684C83|nr:EAL domain-containing response regulator [Nisaea sediminum]
MLNVLIVDDEPDFAEFVADAVDELGHIPRIATNSSAFASAYSTHIEVIFLDLFLPDLDGIEILRFLSDNRSTASVVLMSGSNDALLNAAREIAHERGITVLGVLRKPITLASIAETLSAYEPAPSVTKRSSSRIDIDDIRQGLKNGEFSLFYQPQISLKDGSVTGAEALIRWNHPDMGVVAPEAFVPQVESSDLIGPMTDYVVSRACRDLSELEKDRLLFRISINLSANSIYDLSLPEKLARQFDDSGIDPGHVVLEITETAVMKDVAASIDVLTRLRMKGFHLSIDDFGIGYSSMEQLVRIPFSELKVDQKFVRSLLESREYRSVAEVSIALGHKLDMTVIAEGIEDAATMSELRVLGCDEAQGFEISRPLPLDELKTWIGERRKA